jgi:phosphoribosylcarboxyaminoimidazole (NCAIR) mutase
MTDKILFIGIGSDKDPGFGSVVFDDGVTLDGTPFKEYMEERGIKVLDKVIESCHGCPELTKQYSKAMQNCVEHGDRVVAVLQGGLLFGLPSIQATQTTYPIISVPLDFVSYTAFMVPRGHAVVAGVGVDGKEDYTQKAKALMLAERILNLEGTKVTAIDDGEGKLEKELSQFGIEIDNTATQPLALVNGLYRLDRAKDAGVVIRADTDEDMRSWEYLRTAEARHHDEHFNYAPTAQVKGVGNLTIYAAKILSLQRPELIKKIQDIAAEKLKTYDKHKRSLLCEIKDRL